jgi:hypothetical protein
MFSEPTLPLGFLFKKRLPFTYDLGALVYPTIETAEENRMSKRPHAEPREHNNTPYEGKGLQRKELDQPATEIYRCRVVEARWRVPGCDILALVRSRRAVHRGGELGVING